MATVSKKNRELIDKISLGFRLAYEKLVREAALHNQSLVFSEQGKPVWVPATELLKKMEGKGEVRS
jgi:hypothetical protein